MRFTTTVSTIALALFVAACAGGGPGSDTYAARDSAGIHIVESVAPVWGEGDAWELGQRPLVDIGGLEGDPVYELYRVTNAVRLTNGRIVIGNSGSNKIRFYDESGTHLLDAGGEGEGPGEFAFVSWVTHTVEGQIAYKRDIGGLPALKAAYDDPRISEIDPYYGLNPFEAILTIPPYNFFNWGTTETLIAKQLDALILGQVSAQEAFDTFVSDIKMELSQWKKKNEEEIENRLMGKAILINA